MNNFEKLKECRNIWEMASFLAFTDLAETLEMASFLAFTDLAETLEIEQPIPDKLFYKEWLEEEAE